MQNNLQSSTSSPETPDNKSSISNFQYLDSLFHPKSVAIIGASADPESRVSIGFIKPILDTGYQGKVYLINPNHKEIMGLKTYPSITAIPERVDYVICSVPAPLTPQVMRDCVAAGVKTVTMYTAGFSESGGVEETKLERELVEIARQGGVRIIGPNCLGIHSPAGKFFIEPESLRESGHVALFCQSGGNTRDLIMMGKVRGIYFNKIVSYGNACDLNESDFLEYFAQDPDTQIIAAYIEGIKQPQRFLKALKQAAETKPVIILKGGITRAGTRAVVSHTGALAGSREIWNALCRQTGVVQVDNLEEMADAILAFSYLKPPRGRRVGLVGTGGGMSVQAADDCENAGLFVLPFPEELRDKLEKSNAMAGASVRNPIDSPPGIYWNSSAFSETIVSVANCGTVDAVMVSLLAHYALQRPKHQILQKQIEAIAEAREKIDKPLAVVLIRTYTLAGEKANFEAHALCFKAGLASYPSVDRAAKALSRFIDYYERRET